MYSTLLKVCWSTDTHVYSLMIKDGHISSTCLKGQCPPMMIQSNNVDEIPMAYFIYFTDKDTSYCKTILMLNVVAT